MGILVKTRVPGFINKVYRTKYGIWVPGFGEANINRNVLFVLGKPEGKMLIPAKNIVTDAGDQYYAERGAAETPTNAFNRLYMSSVTFGTSHPAKGSTSANLASVIAGSEKAPETNYPQADNQDADNTGKAVDSVTWKFVYATTDWNDTDVEAGAISITGATFPGGSNPLLCGFNITSFAKTASDTLTVYVNHNFLGS